MRRSWLLVFLLVALAGCGGGQAEENKAIVRGYLTDILLHGDQGRWDDYFLDAVVFNGIELTRDEMLRNAGLIRGAFPDFQFIIEDQIAEGDKVVTRLTFLGTQNGDFMGIPANGNHVVYRGIALDRIIDGKVVEMWQEVDTWGMLQQMGVR